MWAHRFNTLVVIAGHNDLSQLSQLLLLYFLFSFTLQTNGSYKTKNRFCVLFLRIACNVCP